MASCAQDGGDRAANLRGTLHVQGNVPAVPDGARDGRFVVADRDNGYEAVHAKRNVVKRYVREREENALRDGRYDRPRNGGPASAEGRGKEEENS